MFNEQIIKNFGFPESLKYLQLEFCFNDILEIKDARSILFNCLPEEVNFCIYNPSSMESLFEMSFYIRENYSNRAFGSIEINERLVVLQSIRTCAAFRKQGIATYYIEKLRAICLENNVHVMRLNVASSNSDTLNILNNEQLYKFYKSFSLDEFKVVCH